VVVGKRQQRGNTDTKTMDTINVRGTLGLLRILLLGLSFLSCLFVQSMLSKICVAIYTGA
jgi:hypothetical protein